MDKNKDLFLDFLEAHERASKSEDMLTKAGLCTIDFLDNYYGMMRTLQKMIFNDGQIEVLDWYLYDNTDKKIFNKDGSLYKELDTPAALWDYLQELC